MGEDELDRLTAGELEHLAGRLMGVQHKKVPRVRPRMKKIKHRAEWESLDDVGLNQTVKVTIELPGYLVAGMAGKKNGYREAVSEYLIKRGETWWQPRFMSVLKAKQIEAARRRYDASRQV